MRISIMAFGSRGDVEPALALEQRLRDDGHEVVLAVPSDQQTFARQGGAVIRPVHVDAREFLTSPEGQDMLDRGDVRSYVARMLAKKREMAGTLHRDLVAAAEGADVVVGTRLVEEESSTIAEWLGVPFVALHYVPVRSNSRLPAPMVTTRQLTGPGNRLTHLLADQVQWRHGRAAVNTLRRTLGLPEATAPVAVRLAERGSTEIQAYSRHVVPELAAWGPRRPVVGFLRLSPARRAALGSDHQDTGLDRWLADGDAPVYFGFGSMPVGDGRKMLETVNETAERLGVRALVAAGWSDLPADLLVGGRVRVAPAIDHTSVLPRCRLAVHHGGAGTTAASLGAGLPTLICSVFADQPFWGQAVTRLGVGATMRRIDVTASSLTRMIESSSGEDVALRAKRLGEALSAEDAVAAAARLVVASR